MTTEETAKEYFEHRFRALDGETQREEKLMCGIAYRVLRQKTENNAPLTLDELREMDGEPVYIVECPDWGHWELSENAEDYLEGRDPHFYGMKLNDPAGRYGLYKLGWLAYRCKPEER